MAFEGSKEKIGILAELWVFMRVRKKCGWGPSSSCWRCLACSWSSHRAPRWPRSSTRCSKPRPDGALFRAAAPSGRNERGRP